jgi:hypothetical protein
MQYRGIALGHLSPRLILVDHDRNVFLAAICRSGFTVFPIIANGQASISLVGILRQFDNETRAALIAVILFHA